MKYMVVECHLSYAVVLDEEGRFLKAANRNYEVGQMITDIIEMQAPPSNAPSSKKSGRRWISALTALAACLLLLVIPYQMGRTPYASVYMTINPEVRIDVTRNDLVIGLEGVNDDGRILVHNYSYKKKALDLVMDELVDRAIDEGFLHEGGQITLTLDSKDGEWTVTHGDTLGAHLNEHVSKKLSVTIEVNGTAANKHQIIIPVIPETSLPSSSYSNSDYGESDYLEETTAPKNSDVSSSGSTSEESNSSSNYTDYDEPDHEDEPGDDTESADYNEASNYDEPDSNDGSANYSESENSGSSNYGDGHDGQSSYDSPYEEND